MGRRRNEMSSWNYRIFKRIYPGCVPPNVFYELHEVYYDDDKKILGWTKKPEAGPAESVEELLREVRMKARDAWTCREDILDYEMEPEADWGDE